MHFINENNLDTWVRGNAQLAQGLIVELIAKLVSVSSPKPREKRFPLGDSISQHGPDGHLDAVISHNPYVPEGKSFWEIGTNLDAKKKASSDYNSLTLITPEIVRKDSTFVFVTPLSGRRDWEHTWAEEGQISWVQEKKQAGEWKDVRVIDGTKLVDWIHQFITVELWLANKTLSLNEHQVETLEQKWDLVKSIGEPPQLAINLFLANRTDSCSKLLEMLESGNAFKFKLNTHFSSEASIFVAAYVASLPEEKRLEISGRAVIVSGEAAWNNLCTRNENLILIAESSIDLNSDHGVHLLQKARKNNHSVIYSGPKGGVPDPSSILLTMPRSHHVEEELKKSGYSEERSRVLAQQCNGNLTILLRYIQNLSAIPEWAQNTQGSDIKIISLIGSWNENSETDKTAIESIVGKPYGEWITKIRSASSKQSAPLTFRDGKWKLISHYEAWYALGSHLSDEDIDRFQKTVIELLKRKDPKFELEIDQRYAAQIFGKLPPYSNAIKNGIADTIALLGSQPRALTQCSEDKAEVAATLIVREVLANADWQLWATLNDILPLLAEASPNEFLSAIENELLKPNSSFADLFNQEGNGITGSIYTTGILWGLETLAWDANYLPRVSLCLGYLAAKDPGGQWSNRPSNSLRNIFLPWYPQTTAPIERRFLAINSLNRELPEIGWKLILELLPENFSSTSGGRKPAWRSSIPDDWERGVTNNEYWDQIEKYSEIAIETAKGNKTRIAELIEYLDGLPETFHGIFLGYLGSEDFVNSPEESRAAVWDALMDLVGKHRKFHDADWALSKEIVDRIATAADKISPKSPEHLFKRNFANRSWVDLNEEDNYEKQMKMIARKQENAVLQIYSSGGINKIENFIHQVEMPYSVGRALGAVGPKQIDTEILPLYLEAHDKILVSFVASFVSSRFHHFSWAWVKDVMETSWSKEKIAKLFSHLPFVRDTWDEAKKILAEDESIYWKLTTVNPYLEKSDLAFGIKKLLDNGRPNAAIDCLHKLVWEEKKIDPDLTVRALLESLNSDEPANSRDGHHMVEIIKNLQANPDTSPKDLFRVEWAYLPILEKSNGATPVILERKLADDPNFFCEVIQLVFKSKKDTDKKDKPKDEHTQSIATNAYRLLNKWRVPPGSKADGTFDSDILKGWLEKVKAKVSESGHLEVSYLMIGNVLIYTPADTKSGLWINEGVANILNLPDNQNIRDGFKTATFNSRGVFWGSGGKQELVLSESFKVKAQALEDKGFIRFATTLRGLSDSYKKDSEREASRGDDE